MKWCTYVDAIAENGRSNPPKENIFWLLSIFTSQIRLFSVCVITTK